MTVALLAGTVLAPDPSLGTVGFSPTGGVISRPLADRGDGALLQRYDERTRETEP